MGHPERDRGGRPGLSSRRAVVAAGPLARRRPHVHSQQRALGRRRVDRQLEQSGLVTPGTANCATRTAILPVPHHAGLLRSMRTSSTPQGLWSGAADPRLRQPATRCSCPSTGCAGPSISRARCGGIEQLGKQQADDARYYRRQMDKFLADWQAWQLDQIWARPEDFFVESHGHFAKLRRIGENALRANPHLVAFSSTHPIVETGFCGSGTTNAFRELKPGLIDAAYELAAPLRWCLFVEPVNVYRGTRVRLEAVLANEDVLRPGKYPVRLQVVGPKTTRVWETDHHHRSPAARRTSTSRPLPSRSSPTTCSWTGLRENTGSWPRCSKAGLPTAARRSSTSAIRRRCRPSLREVVLWGEDAELGKWLAGTRRAHAAVRRWTTHGARGHPGLGQGACAGRAAVFAELARRIARGSTVVFLDPATLSDGQNATRWAPLKGKGLLAGINWVGGYYRADMWAKNHPIFDGLPSGGLLDPTFYRETLAPARPAEMPHGRPRLHRGGGHRRAGPARRGGLRGESTERELRFRTPRGRVSPGCRPLHPQQSARAQQPRPGAGGRAALAEHVDLRRAGRGPTARGAACRFRSAFAGDRLRVGAGQGQGPPRSYGEDAVIVVCANEETVRKVVFPTATTGDSAGTVANTR